MLYALLAAVPTVLPTATPMPTPTGSPTPLPVFVSIVENTADKPGFLENVGAISSIIIGIAAFVVSIVAIIISIQQNKKANKIAIMDKAFEVYNYFKTEILEPNYFHDRSGENMTKSYDRFSNICYLIQLLFSPKARKEFSILTDNILDILHNGVFPDLPNDVDRSKIYGETEEEKKEYFFHFVFINIKINEIFEEYQLNL